MRKLIVSVNSIRRRCPALLPMTEQELIPAEPPAAQAVACRYWAERLVRVRALGPRLLDLWSSLAQAQAPLPIAKYRAGISWRHSSLRCCG